MALRPYQERAVQEMIDKPRRYLAFDLGLGKTRICLEYLARTRQKAIVFAPLLVAQRVWGAEIDKWSYPLRWATCYGDARYRVIESDIDVILISYSTLKWVYEYGEKHGAKFLRDRVIIFDEATAFKRSSSQRWKMLRAMQHLFKRGVFLLSGGPMPGGYADLWSQYWLLDRGAALGSSFSAFKQRWFTENPYNYKLTINPGAAEDIQSRVAELTLMLRAEDYVTLPEVVTQTINVELPSEAREFYDRTRKESVLEGEAMDAGVKINKLRQITQGGFYSRDAGEHELEQGAAPVRAVQWLHTSKLDALEALVEEANGDPILCPVYFLFEADSIRNRLGRHVPIIAGGMSVKEKQRILTSWDAGDVPLLLCHPASLSHGLNMQTGGHIIVWYSLPWSLEQYKQLNGRLARPGQSRPVRIYHICARRTMDQYVVKVLEDKDASERAFQDALADASLGWVEEVEES